MEKKKALLHLNRFWREIYWEIFLFDLVFFIIIHCNLWAWKSNCKTLSKKIAVWSPCLTFCIWQTMGFYQVIPKASSEIPVELKLIL